MMLLINRMSVNDNPKEMVRYFSDFMTEVNLILKNIKQTVYELVNISVSSRAHHPISPNMSSIVLATSKTYDDLKRVESILNGLARSRRQPKSQTVKSSRRRAISESLKPILSAKQMFPAAQGKLKLKSFDLKTIKRQKEKSPRRQIKEELQKSDSSEELTYRINKNKNRQDAETIRNNYQPYGSPQVFSLKTTFNIEERVNRLIKSNRESITSIIERNNECLRLVKSVKKQITLKS